MLAQVWNQLVSFSSKALLAVPEASEAANQKFGAFSAAAGGADFQPKIFWAYSLACALLFLFTVWNVAETRNLGKKIAYLKERFRQVHPEALGEDLG